MSELREECRQCVNNQKCIGRYESIHCMINRKYDFKNIDYGSGKDKTSKTIIIECEILENKIKNLKHKLLTQQYENYKEKFKIEGMIQAYEAILNFW